VCALLAAQVVFVGDSTLLQLFVSFVLLLRGVSAATHCLLLSSVPTD
tara:strand:+ start:609 stop:749 length:141 start_codon:yes stop_codon:yes gene_type:complete